VSWSTASYLREDRVHRDQVFERREYFTRREWYGSMLSTSEDGSESDGEGEGSESGSSSESGSYGGYYIPGTDVRVPSTSSRTSSSGSGSVSSTSYSTSFSQSTSRSNRPYRSLRNQGYRFDTNPYHRGFYIRTDSERSWRRKFSGTKPPWRRGVGEGGLKLETNSEVKRQLKRTRGWGSEAVENENRDGKDDRQNDEKEALERRGESAEDECNDGNGGPKSKG
jgi:hypothetical protein